MTKYWVGNGGDWANAAHWSASSGGAGGAGQPAITEDAVFDANSFSSAGQIVTIPAGECLNLDMSLVTNIPEFQWTSVNFIGDLYVHGNLTIPANTKFTLNNGSSGRRGIQMKATADKTVHLLSTQFNVDLIFHTARLDSTLVTYTLTSSLKVRRFINTNFSHAPVKVKTNSNAITASEINFYSNAGADIVDMGSSAVTLVNGFTEQGDESTYINSGGIFTNDFSSIDVQGNGVISGATLHDVTISSTTGINSGLIEIIATTFHNLTLAAGASVQWRVGDTFIVSGLFTSNGADMSTTVTGSQVTLTIHSADVSFTSIQDLIAAGAAAPITDSSGIDNGNNENWLFANALTISDVSELTFDSATLQINTDFNLDISTFDEVGIIYSDVDLLPSFALGNPFIIIFGILGPFFVNLTGLIPGQTYYIRTYIKFGSIYLYGPVISFTVPTHPIPVAVTDNLASKYQFEIFDEDGNLVADLSGYVTDRAFTLTRNRAEEISFSINLYTLSQLCLALHITPADILKTGINSVRVKRAGIVICAGQIIYWSTNLAQETIEVKAKGWLELLSYRVFSGTYAGQTAAFIARDIITQTQALTDGNFGFTLGTNPGGTNTYADKVFENKTISDGIIEMSEEDDGFDFEFTWDKVFNLYFPGMGQVRDDILFTFPGNTKDIQVSEDSTRIVNSLLGRGKGNADANINTIIDDLTSQGTYKLRTNIKDYPDMVADQLVKAASSEVFAYKDPLFLRTIVYDGNNPACPAIGTFGLGDRIRSFIKLLDVFSGANGNFVIDKIDVKLGSGDEETVTLSVN